MSRPVLSALSNGVPNTFLCTKTVLSGFFSQAEDKSFFPFESNHILTVLSVLSRDNRWTEKKVGRTAYTVKRTHVDVFFSSL